MNSVARFDVFRDLYVRLQKEMNLYCRRITYLRISMDFSCVNYSAQFRTNEMFRENGLTASFSLILKVRLLLFK